MILTKNQGKNERDKERIWIRKSRCIELDRTYCCTGNFNIALSLYRVLGVTFYFSKGFSEVVEALQLLEQEFNL